MAKADNSRCGLIQCHMCQEGHYQLYENTEDCVFNQPKTYVSVILYCLHLCFSCCTAIKFVASQSWPRGNRRGSILLRNNDKFPGVQIFRNINSGVSNFLLQVTIRNYISHQVVTTDSGANLSCRAVPTLSSLACICSAVCLSHLAALYLTSLSMTLLAARPRNCLSLCSFSLAVSAAWLFLIPSYVEVSLLCFIAGNTGPTRPRTPFLSPIEQKRRKMACQPRHFTAEPNIAMTFSPFRWTNTPHPVPPFLLTMNQSSIFRSDTMKLKVPLQIRKVGINRWDWNGPRQNISFQQQLGWHAVNTTAYICVESYLSCLSILLIAKEKETCQVASCSE